MCPSCAKLEACLEKTQDSKECCSDGIMAFASFVAMTTRLKEQADAFKVKEEKAKKLLLEQESVSNTVHDHVIQDK